MDGALAGRRLHDDLDARAVGEAVRAPALELQREEVVRVAGVLVERVEEVVALVEAAELVEDVLVAVVVEVGERDAVALLEVAEAARDRDVGEVAPADVAQHHVRHERVVGRATPVAR